MEENWGNPPFLCNSTTSEVDTCTCFVFHSLQASTLILTLWLSIVRLHCVCASDRGTWALPPSTCTQDLMNDDQATHRHRVPPEIWHWAPGSPESPPSSQKAPWSWPWARALHCADRNAAAFHKPLSQLQNFLMGYHSDNFYAHAYRVNGLEWNRWRSLPASMLQYNM